MDTVLTLRRFCNRWSGGALLGSALVLGLTPLAAQQPVRSHITGIANVGFYTTDLHATEVFWHDLLGYDQAYTFGETRAGKVDVAVIKLNDLQNVELFTQTATAPPSMMHHLSFAVDDVQAMMRFLRAQGYAIEQPVHKTAAGDLAVSISDPNGMRLDFVQLLPSGRERRGAGQHLPAARIAPRIYHVGFMTGDADRTEAFFRGLGFAETWRGGANPKELSWINLKVPDGEDYIELMLYPSLPKVAEWGSRNHVSLVVPDIQAAVTSLEARPAFKGYSKPVTIRTGVNQKRQVNLFDPDGTRVELMEPKTLTGQPAAWSKAPVPAPSHEKPFEPAVAAKAARD